ncbi:MAG: hypothetical protein JXB39_01155 [Deltaproteobacteria bacterium]|nr:hypothetical protein [Deltaproteobacteria bacterium]
MVTILLWAGLLGCYGHEYPPGVLVPVDCTGLPVAPLDVVEAVEPSEAALTDASLKPGTVHVVIQWIDEDGGQWYQARPTGDAWVAYASEGPGPNGWPTWDIVVPLPCVPTANVNLHFGREDGSSDPLAPGSYPVVTVSIDVPDKEQAANRESRESDGVVIVTETNEGSASGYMQGWGTGSMESNVSKELLGLEYKVGALAFNTLPF